MRIRVGTRGSELALTQTRAIMAELRRRQPQVEIEEFILKTRGDQDQKTPLAAQGGVGVFTKELEQALLDNRCDVAVHSLKDLPTCLPEGLVLGAVPEREEPWDAFISEKYADLVDLPAGGVVATGSLRRKAQILHRFPQLKVVGIRGNIDTRLSKYSEIGADGLVLALAGLKRIGRAGVVRSTFGPTEMTPAPAQGALGLEVRADDDATLQLLADIDHGPTRTATTAERAFLAEIEGGCHLPIGALANVRQDHLVLTGMLATADGRTRLQLSVEGSAEDPAAVAQLLVAKMRRAGADDIIATYRSDMP